MKPNRTTKHWTLAIALLALVGVGLGCKPATRTPAGDSSAATARDFDRVAKETKEAADEMKDYTYAQRQEYLASMQGRLDAINRDLDQLEAKIDKASDAAKADAKPKLEAMRAQAANLKKQLEAAKDATESTWEDVKAGVKKGYGELKEGFQASRQWLSEAIAP